MNDRREKKPSTISLKTHSTINFWSGLIGTLCGMAAGYVQIYESPLPPTVRMLAIPMLNIGFTVFFGLMVIAYTHALLRKGWPCD